MAATKKTCEAWFCYHSGEDVLKKDLLVKFFQAENISLTRPEKTTAHTGLIFFNSVDGGLVNQIRDNSRHQGARVLAVALTALALSGCHIWQLLQAGASDVLVWDAADSAAAIAARLQRFAQVDEIIESPLVRNNLVGTSASWIAALRDVAEVGAFTDSSVLLTGESGTGKEMISRLIHTLDRRQDKGDMVVLDCTTVVPELAGSEFFGHERGAFTHAVQSRDGAFALANQGTLFLDEIGELPLTLQADLLRVIQERSYKRVGGNTWKQVNFRLICATNRNLIEEEARGGFRRDLYHRIASWKCHLPSLAERRDDIPLLVRHFLKEFSPNGEAPELNPTVQEYLQMREYPGNVRELRHVVAGLAKRHVGKGPITPGEIPAEERVSAAEFMQQDWRDDKFQHAIRRAITMGVTLREIGQQTTEVAIQIALTNESGNLQRAAQKLGVTDRALQMRRAAQRGDSENADVLPPSNKPNSPLRRSSSLRSATDPEIPPLSISP
ncbi:MAG: sigma-54-dependent Fis family transcriptional regulator [Verrucomicrobia bacterium]|nr:sigma-54-dependent Fis family transcriptional regulator [Verrucomicrobiota bacterium]